MVSNKFIRAFLFLALFGASAAAQENRYMVFFKDKAGIPQTLSRPIDFLSEKAIQRRLNQNIDINDLDLPVKKEYIQSVRDAGPATFFTTRWLNAVLVQCDAALVPALEGLSFVHHVELVAPEAKLQSGGRRSFNLRRKNSTIGVETESQLQMIGIDKMHQAGYRGEGVVIAILDSGFPGVDAVPAFHHVFRSGCTIIR